MYTNSVQFEFLFLSSALTFRGPAFYETTKLSAVTLAQTYLYVN
jgi:hypothetical protein